MTASIPTLTLVRMIPAAPRDVFEAWLDPAVLRTFMFPTESTRVGKTEVDARIGGKFSIVMLVADRELPHHGEYLEIQRYERLVFTWRSPVAGEGSRVSLRFEPAAHGHTRLTLEHEGLSDMHLRESHEEGWSRILSELGLELGSRN